MMRTDRHFLDELAEALAALSDEDLDYLTETSLEKARRYRDESEKDWRKHLSIYATLKDARESTRNHKERRAYGSLRSVISDRLRRRMRGQEMAARRIARAANGQGKV